jgi:hypothetical protein
LNSSQFLRNNDIRAPVDRNSRVQSRSNKARGCFDEGRRNNAPQSSDAIMLQNDKEGISAATGEIEIFNDVELSRQSKHPHAVGKKAMRFDHLVVSVNRFFVFFIPLACGLLAL